MEIVTKKQKILAELMSCIERVENDLCIHCAEPQSAHHDSDLAEVADDLRTIRAWIEESL